MSRHCQSNRIIQLVHSSASQVSSHQFIHPICVSATSSWSVTRVNNSQLHHVPVVERCFMPQYNSCSSILLFIYGFAPGHRISSAHDILISIFFGSSATSHLEAPKLSLSSIVLIGALVTSLAAFETRPCWDELQLQLWMHLNHEIKGCRTLRLVYTRRNPWLKNPAVT